MSFSPYIAIGRPRSRTRTVSIWFYLFCYMNAKLEHKYGVKVEMHGTEPVYLGAVWGRRGCRNRGPTLSGKAQFHTPYSEDQSRVLGTNSPDDIPY